ncbi:hypothetical protein ACES2L_09980 [Bdellovibrio bacteriovorus]
MEKLILRSVLLVSLFILTSCAAPEEAPDSVGIDANTIISGSFSNYDNLSVAGTGTLFFTDVLATSRRAFQLKASLDNITTSWVEVIFYGSNSSFPGTNGISIYFQRNGASVSSIVVFDNAASSVTATNLAYYFPTDIDVFIEVHNDGSKARVLVWRRNMVSYVAASADIDTNRAGDLASAMPNTVGSGGFVGLRMQSATVTSAKVISAKVID